MEDSSVIVILNVKFVAEQAVVISSGRKFIFCLSSVLHFAKFTLCHANTIIFASKMLFSINLKLLAKILI